MMETALHKQTPIYEGQSKDREAGGWLAAPPVALGEVTLADQSARGKLLLQGAGLTPLLQQLWELPDLAPPAGATFSGGYAFCLRPDRTFLSLPVGTEAKILARLKEARADGDQEWTVTELTHGRAELWLQGPGATAILSHLCGLDFHPDAFPNLAAKESSVARTHQLILRHDQEGKPTYALIGPRSFGAYLWQVLTETGQQLAGAESLVLDPGSR